jgi:hypothetical protein
MVSRAARVSKGRGIASSSLGVSCGAIIAPAIGQRSVTHAGGDQRDQTGRVRSCERVPAGLAPLYRRLATVPWPPLG